MFQQLKENGVSQMQFHIPPATSFLRLHSLKKFGDDLSSFRFTVVEAIKDKKMVEGLEEGKGGWGFRVVVPMSYEGNFKGTFESGMEFDSKFLKEAIKKQLGGDYFFYQLDDKNISWAKSNKKFLAGTLDEDKINVSPKTIKTAVSSGKVAFEYTKDKTGAVLILPIKDFKGETRGYIKAIIDRKDVINKLNTNLTDTILRGIIILVLALTSIFFIINSALLKPLQLLIERMKKAAQGDLTVETNGGKLMKCWEEKKCSKTECIGYKNSNLRCWQLAGTYCGGSIQGDAMSKQKNCEGCHVYKNATGSEVAAVSEIFNNLITSQKGLITQIQGTARTLSAATQELSATVSEQTTIVHNNINTLDSATKLIENNVGSLKTITDNLDDVSKGADNVAQVTTQVVENSEKVKNQAEAGNEMMTQTDKAITNVVEITNDINTTALELEQASLRIGEIVDVITNIAGQTNLLALNAAIEAARAGDAGRGFAVVAEEVRKLAEQSSSSTKEIASIITDIQNKTRKTVGMIKDSKDIIAVGKDKTKETAETIEKIVKAIAEISEEMQDIASTSEQQAALTNQISSIIHSTDKDFEGASKELLNTNSKMKDQAQMYEEVNATTEELASMAEELLGCAARFKV
jgi:methyl-accepting chemotaxis protein